MADIVCIQILNKYFAHEKPTILRFGHGADSHALINNIDDAKRAAWAVGEGLSALIQGGMEFVVDVIILDEKDPRVEKLPWYHERFKVQE